MTQGDHAVLVLDDDPSILSSLERLLTGHGYRVRLRQEPEDFFGPACRPCRPA